ncbi:AraC-like ligand binding domain-containing protein [Paenibacillus sp. UNCCL117]|uniref:AraC family transcriptional regulator n=1 Tax=unclassified Paenibacillus TaxID=185978 RepID=UPI000891754C|nr:MULTISPECIES: helix-turn-helix domain-containing protein [unclassified Paenibacillus]SDE19356.1 AraC-like ligand binding domain-containing protein [Paenibacillus sp. cl123]SFW62029.1 AraC-like ligand binding domain-containing protein [Paenibacillus sp. UNCCL117]
MNEESSVLSIQPSIRAAHYHAYAGRRREKNRFGYCYAFHLIDKGAGSLLIGGRSYPLKKGTLAFIPPGIEHSFHMSEEQPISSYDMYCDFFVKLETVQHLYFDPPHDYEAELMTLSRPGRELDQLTGVTRLSRYPELIQTFIQVVRLNRLGIQYKSEIVGSLLYSWILQLVNLSISDNIPDYRIQKIIDLMEQYPGMNPPYEQWLELCQLKKSQFYSMFKKMTGLTPKECFFRIKMQRAYATIQESDRSITSIAEELGYSSIHYFSKQFSTYFGLPPSELRRQAQEAGPPSITAKRSSSQ